MSVCVCVCVCVLGGGETVAWEGRQEVVWPKGRCLLLGEGSSAFFSSLFLVSFSPVCHTVSSGTATVNQDSSVQIVAEEIAPVADLDIAVRVKHSSTNSLMQTLPQCAFFTDSHTHTHTHTLSLHTHTHTFTHGRYHCHGSVGCQEAAGCVHG